MFLLSPSGCPAADIPRTLAALTYPSPHLRKVQKSGTESPLEAFLPGIQ